MATTEPGSWDIWSPQDSFTLGVVLIAVAALLIALSLAFAYAAVWRKWRQARRDLQAEQARNRVLARRLRVAVWDARVARGYRPSPREHLGLSRPSRDEPPGEPPEWAWMPDPVVLFTSGEQLAAAALDDTGVMEAVG